MRNKLKDDHYLQLKVKVKVHLDYPYHFHGNPYNSLNQGCFFL